MVLNSNRFGVVGASSTLSLVDGARGKVLGTVRAGAFPREAAVSSDRKTLLVANWTSQELEAVRLGSLPGVNDLLQSGLDFLPVSTEGAETHG